MTKKKLAIISYIIGLYIYISLYICVIYFLFPSPTSLALNENKLELTIAVKSYGLCLSGIWKTGIN